MLYFPHFPTLVSGASIARGSPRTVGQNPEPTIRRRTARKMLPPGGSIYVSPSQQKERTNRFKSRNVLSFSLRRYVCKQTRYTRFARAIYCRFAPMRYDINPLTLLTYLACGEECKSISLGVALYRSRREYRKSRKGFISLRVLR